MKKPKPTTYAEYKAQQDAVKQARQNFKASNPYAQHGSMLTVGSPPDTPTKLLEQFFELRYRGVSQKTILAALDKAYTKGSDGQ